MNTLSLKRTRIDCILIWGHGMKDFDYILNDIIKNENFNIIKIHKHKPKNIKKFVKEMYSYDYAPFWHLKAKTKYLLKIPREVCFVFVRNLLPNEDYLGENSFRHKESLTLKAFKEKLRDDYNPYENRGRTHNHVIHATDSQEQTEHMMKYLGYETGVKYFESENRFVDLPYYIKDYKNFEFKLVNTDDIFCNIIKGKSWDSFFSTTVHVKESPQYRGLSEDITLYQEYINKYLGGPLQENYNVERYKKVCEDFEYLKEPYQNSFVIVERKENKYIVLDGLHRVCSHIYQGNRKIKVCQISK
jgi:hypothetical protein